MDIEATLILAGLKINYCERCFRSCMKQTCLRCKIEAKLGPQPFKFYEPTNVVQKHFKLSMDLSKPLSGRSICS